MERSLPQQDGLYDPRFEHSNCGVCFVVDKNGNKSNKIIQDGLQALINLNHRGACGCDPRTGDGAGILIQLPHKFLKRECAAGTNIEGKEGFSLPEPGCYGVGMVFLPQIPTDRYFCEGLLEEIISDEGLCLLGWRLVPVDNRAIGEFAKDVEPRIRQVFVKPCQPLTQDELERRLYAVRKRVQKLVYEQLPRAFHYFYIASFSTRTLVYKGMLICTQLSGYYLDLQNDQLESALALAHQRYSTNTFPTWDLAQPFRYLGHNGEINTLWGNINWMAARERQVNTDLFGKDFERVLPICKSMGSDSALLDNALEFLVLGGRSLAHSLMMLIPQAWENDSQLDDRIRAFYEFHAAFMEPWDGPAAVAFSDGRQIGALLDRNGLRPARYSITQDGLVVLASETGVLDIPAEQIVCKGRLRPGEMLIVDVEKGQILFDQQLKEEVAQRKPYGQWLKRYKVQLSKLSSPPLMRQPSLYELREMHNVFGYSIEDIRSILEPMAKNGVEPTSSMGHDTPPAVLSDKPQLLYNYFRQRFAQVTNPPIDPTREDLVMSTIKAVGGEGDLLDEKPMQCHQIELPHPVLTNRELQQIRHYSMHHFRTYTLPMLYAVEGRAPSLEKALDEMCQRASEAIRAGNSMLILSDRNSDAFRTPIPALLAVSAVHQHLVREGTRTKVGIIVESGEPREIHHFCLLCGYGASAINPYLAFESITDMVKTEKIFSGMTVKQAHRNYIRALCKGMLKVMSKMGISTMFSYHGAQIFEALGLGQSVIDKYFPHTPSPIGGIGLEVIADECRQRHSRAYPHQANHHLQPLDPGGDYRWRRQGERHLIDPDSLAKLQQAVRTNDFATYQEFADNINPPDTCDQPGISLRSLLRFQRLVEPIPLEQVEPESEIVRRFSTGAMSFGSISKEAHETLAIAMNRLGGKSNTGEGGESSERFVPLANGDWKRSAIKQVASGRFGVTAEYCVNADELQIKIAQGAKPGEGGQLPGHKVNEIIAKTRHSTPGVGLISPPPHHDIYSIEDLAQLIYDLHSLNPKARVSVKLVAESGVGTIAAGVTKAKADAILISCASGGTGAAPMSSIRHAGSPWELGLSETHQVLVKNDLRRRVRLQVDGKLATGRDVAIASMLGAEEFGFATLPLIAIGCTMLRKCHQNTCPFGIATQDAKLRRNFRGKVEHVINYFNFVARELRLIMADLGIRSVEEMVGRVELLVPLCTNHPKARHLDLSPLLHRPRVPRSIATRAVEPQDHGIEDALDHVLIQRAKQAIEHKQPVRAQLKIQNVHRSVGTMLSGQIALRHGDQGLAEDTIQFDFIGSAGQSFGAWAIAGVTLRLQGDANDYVGKGLSGGKLIIYPNQNVRYVTEDNIIVGNVALYGATSGQVFIRGCAGERFAVRNSGAWAVVEGIGDHGCEYMTGGLVVVLGPLGRNFAAGMSGGIAYLYDPDRLAKSRCNQKQVDLEPLQSDDLEHVKALIEKHDRYTSSGLAQKLLDNWQQTSQHFLKVFPKEYRRVLELNQTPRHVEAAS